MPFSLRPDVNSTNERGEHIITDRNPYIALGGHPDMIYYTPKENKYWLTEGVELDKELFETRYINRLSWKFDKFETDKSGKKRNVFPPTPENIAEMRKQIALEAVNAGEPVNNEEVLNVTSPLMLRPSPEFEAQLDKSSGDEKLARRLNSSSRY